MFTEALVKVLNSDLRIFKEMKKLTTIKTFAFLLLIYSLLLQNLPFVQAQTPSDINAQIRKEGMENSQIMRTIHYFSDVYGPRLTGSPNHKAAGNGRSNKC